MKSRPAGLHIGIGQVFFISEGDGVDQDVETAPFLLERRENFLDLFVLGHVAGQDNFRADSLGQRPHALLQNLAGEGKGQLRPLGMKRLRDRPSDAPLIGHAKDRRLFPLQQFHERLPAYFGFWIFDFRLSDRESRTRSQEFSSTRVLPNPNPSESPYSSLFTPNSHLMILLARANTSGGIVMPSCFAVFRLMTKSNFLGRSTGMSAGFVPLRIISTISAARRNISARSSP